jgi:hypothetical protein
MYKIFRGGVLRLSDGKYIDNNNHTEWKEYNNWLNQGNQPQAEDPVPQPTITIEDLRDNKVQLLDQKASQLRGRLNQGMDHNKYMWLMVQREEARGPGNPAPGTMIAKIAQKAGITPNQVKDIINAYFDTKLDLGAEIEGTYLKHLLALRALTTKQEIRDYDITTEWPNIPLKRVSER